MDTQLESEIRQLRRRAGSSWKIHESDMRRYGISLDAVKEAARSGLVSYVVLITYRHGEKRLDLTSRPYRLRDFRL
jgi:hypothetical protein